VVFDLDGLLVDSEGAWGRAEQRAVASLGHPWDPTIRTLLLGRAPQDAAVTLAAFLDEPSRTTEIARLLLVFAGEELRRGLVTRPGARELVEALSGRVPIAVATNSRRVLADIALDGTGLLPHVTAIVSADDVVEPKPAPEPYLRACQALQVLPERTVAFEDSPLGVTSAKAAGLWVVGCPSFASEPIAHADAVVASLGEIDPAVLLHR